MLQYAVCTASPKLFVFIVLYYYVRVMVYEVNEKQTTKKNTKL